MDAIRQELEDVARYLAEWGLRVTQDRAGFQPQEPWLFPSPFSFRPLAPNPSDDDEVFASPWIDHRRGVIYFPEEARRATNLAPGSSPFLLLHEGAHLLLDQTNTWEVEEGTRMSAFELLSIAYLRSQGSTLSTARWEEWRVQTGDDITPVSDGRAWALRMVAEGFFDTHALPTFRRWMPKAWVFAASEPANVFNDISLVAPIHDGFFDLITRRKRCRS